MTRLGRTDTYRAVISSPLVSSGFDARGSIQKPNLSRIQKLAAAIFPQTGAKPDKKYQVAKAGPGGVQGSGVSSCGSAPSKPKPKATPKQTPKPNAKATPKPTAKPTSTPEPTATPTEASPEPTPATP
jgi:hypothetical protein